MQVEKTVKDIKQLLAERQEAIEEAFLQAEVSGEPVQAPTLSPKLIEVAKEASRDLVK